MTPRFGAKFFVCLFALALAFGGAIRFGLERLKQWRQRPPVAVPQPSHRLTFSKHIAPIVFDQCAECHRPQGAGPFSLLDYSEVKRHAKEIVEVTRNRIMPPWLPKPGLIDFVNQRLLTTNQIRTIEQWVAEGAVEGDPADLPPVPKSSGGWRLGQPDQIVSPQGYTLAATDKDVYRNFVIPVPGSTPRRVRAVEFHPGNPKLVHHAVLQVDSTPASRQRDAQDPEPGFSGGMSMGTAHLPDGHFIGWTPGKRPFPGLEGASWRLEPGMDLVLQLHMRPSGKPETVQPEIGLYFTKEPVTLFPHALVLRSKSIDIPEGQTNYQITASYELPVDVEVLSIYPHAHYLGKEMKVKATLPDKTERWLLHIEQWDFNWQDEYRYVTPIGLPKGTVLSMEYLYDNSSENPRNPHHPPQRVRYGQNSTDEMAELMLQVLPRSREDFETLERHTARQALLEEIKVAEARLPAERADPQQHIQLASLHRRVGHAPQAVNHLLKALEIDSRLPNAHHDLGDLFAEAGRFDEARQHFQEANAIDPERVQFLDSFAQILARHPNPQKRDPARAVALAQRAVMLTQQKDHAMLETLAVAHAAAGQFKESVAAAELAIEAAQAAGARTAADAIRKRLESYKASAVRRGKE